MMGSGPYFLLWGDSMYFIFLDAIINNYTVRMWDSNDHQTTQFQIATRGGCSFFRRLKRYSGT